MLVNWKVFWVLLVASVFGAICITPYTLSMLSVRSGSSEGLPIPLHVLLALQMLQNVVLSAIFIFFGLYLAGRVGLSAPLLEEWSRGGEVKSAFKAILGTSTLLGMLAGILTAALDLVFCSMFPNEPIYAVKLPTPPAWQGFLASFYGAINEEILSRLFLMSLFIWMLSKIGKEGGKPVGLTIWLAIAVTAVISGLLHLPSTAILIPITPFIIARSIILNGIAGAIFGWLYWRKGLESAIMSHFTADIIIHGILPLLI